MPPADHRTTVSSAPARCPSHPTSEHQAGAAVPVSPVLEHFIYHSLSRLYFLSFYQAYHRQISYYCFPFALKKKTTIYPTTPAVPRYSFSVFFFISYSYKRAPSLTASRPPSVSPTAARYPRTASTSAASVRRATTAPAARRAPPASSARPRCRAARASRVSAPGTSTPATRARATR